MLDATHWRHAAFVRSCGAVENATLSTWRRRYGRATTLRRSILAGGNGWSLCVGLKHDVYADREWVKISGTYFQNIYGGRRIRISGLNPRPVSPSPGPVRYRVSRHPQTRTRAGTVSRTPDPDPESVPSLLDPGPGPESGTVSPSPRRTEIRYRLRLGRTRNPVPSPVSPDPDPVRTPKPGLLDWSAPVSQFGLSQAGLPGRITD
jgi:hypothetical protein